MVNGVPAYEILAVGGVVTVVAILFDVAGEPVAHVAVDVITTVIASAFAKPVVVYVDAVSPEISLPFFFHW